MSKRFTERGVTATAHDMKSQLKDIAAQLKLLSIGHKNYRDAVRAIADAGLRALDGDDPDFLDCLEIRKALEGIRDL